MAQAFPASQFHGFDTHAESVTEAQKIAAEAGVAKRVTFATARAENYPGKGYDLICFFDCLHDMGDPVAAATHAAKAIAKDGTVMLVEPFANDQVEDNISTVGAAVLRGLDHDLLRACDLGRRASSCSARRPAKRGWRIFSAKPASRASAAPWRRRST